MRTASLPKKPESGVYTSVARYALTCASVPEITSGLASVPLPLTVPPLPVTASVPCPADRVTVPLAARFPSASVTDNGAPEKDKVW